SWKAWSARTIDISSTTAAPTSTSAWLRLQQLSEAALLDPGQSPPLTSTGAMRFQIPGVSARSTFWFAVVGFILFSGLLLCAQQSKAAPSAPIANFTDIADKIRNRGRWRCLGLLSA